MGPGVRLGGEGVTSWRETQGEADPVVLPSTRNSPSTTVTPSTSSLMRTSSSSNDWLLAVEHQVCLVWTYKPDLGVRCGHLRVRGLPATAAGRQRARGESKSDGTCGRGAMGMSIHVSGGIAAPLRSASMRTLMPHLVPMCGRRLPGPFGKVRELLSRLPVCGAGVPGRPSGMNLAPMPHACCGRHQGWRPGSRTRRHSTGRTRMSGPCR